MKAQEWATRQEDAAGELAAIAKAKEVLESGVKVFLQVLYRHPVLQPASERSGHSSKEFGSDMFA